MKWYVLFVVGGKENQIKSFLNKKYKDWIAFFPMIQKIYRIKGVNSLRLKPLFPNYIFVKSEIDGIEFKRRLFEVRNQMAGIIKELNYENDEIPALREDEIAYLQQLLDKNYKIVPSKGYMKEGRVVITEGPLKGLEDQILKVNFHNRSALLQFKFLDEMKTISVSLEVYK